MDKFKFTAYNQYERDGIVHCMVWFVPKNTIECNPPYIAGKEDNTWIKFRKGNKPRTKEELENCLGMGIISCD